MPRFRTAGPNDDQPVQGGDGFFLGVNQRLDQSVLPPGVVSEAVNMRFRDGVAETRKGVIHVAWVNKLSGGNFVPWGATVHGVGRWRNPSNATEYLVVAADGVVYASYEDSTQVTVPVAAGETIDGDIEFVQCFNVLVMLRGDDQNPLVMENLSDGFVTITQTAEPDEVAGVIPIPRAIRGAFMSNRLFLVPTRETSGTSDDAKKSVTAFAGDNVVFSDVLDYTRYEVTQEFRVNQGENDTLVQITPFGNATLIGLKQNSVYRVDNAFGDLTSATLSKVTSRYGCVAPKSVVDIGIDLLWLSQSGVASLRLTEFGELQAAQGVRQGEPEMLSADIEPTIRRINWEHADKAVGVEWDSKYYLAVPLDDAEVIGEELVPALSVRGTTVTIPVTVGKSYRWVSTGFTLSGGGLRPSKLTNGSESLTDSGDFVAEGTTISIAREDGGSINNATLGDSLKEVTKGVNNAVLVYDLVNKAWSGYDEGLEIVPQEWVKLRYKNRERLFMVKSDGWVKLYEEDYEDELSMPYSSMDVTNPSPIPTGDTLQVNGGTTIDSANLPLGLNDATQFNNDNVTRDFYSPAGNNWGYSQDTSAGTWTAPNTIVRPVSTSELRFISTNNVLPSIVTTANPASSLTRSVGTEVITATYTSSVNHGFETGDMVTISGANEAPYNGTFVITKTGDTTFTYEIDSDPGGSATGSPVTSAPWITVTETSTVAIVSTLVTRGYSSPVRDRLDFQWATMDLQTWSPDYTISTLTEGVEEEDTRLSSITRNRAKWFRPFSKADFDLDNDGGEFMDPHREDYSLELGTRAVTEFAVHTIAAGIRLDLHQETREGVRIGGAARSSRIKIVNNNGRIRVMGVRIEGHPEMTSGRTED